MTTMPTSYMLEKGEALSRHVVHLSHHAKHIDPFIDPRDWRVQAIYETAQALVQEVETWRQEDES